MYRTCPKELLLAFVAICLFIMTTKVNAQAAVDPNQCSALLQPKMNLCLDVDKRYNPNHSDDLDNKCSSECVYGTVDDECPHKVSAQESGINDMSASNLFYEIMGYHYPSDTNEGNLQDMEKRATAREQCVMFCQSTYDGSARAAPPSWKQVASIAAKGAALAVCLAQCNCLPNS